MMDKELLSELDKIVKNYCVCEGEKSTTDEITINRTKEPLFKMLQPRFDFLKDTSTRANLSQIPLQSHGGYFHNTRQRECEILILMLSFLVYDFGLGTVVRYKN